VFPGVPIHPTQLYTSVYSLFVFFVLLAADKSRPRPGSLIGLFLMMEASGRFLIELVRYHDPSSNALAVGDVTLTSYQLMSVALFVLGGGLLLASRWEARHGQHADLRAG
jgi:phosphatidylglycerol:prolipoprotein diacylglycerol transferase